MAYLGSATRYFGPGTSFRPSPTYRVTFGSVAEPSFDQAEYCDCRVCDCDDYGVCANYGVCDTCEVDIVDQNCPYCLEEFFQHKPYRGTGFGPEAAGFVCTPVSHLTSAPISRSNSSQEPSEANRRLFLNKFEQAIIAQEKHLATLERNLKIQKDVLNSLHLCQDTRQGPSLSNDTKSRLKAREIEGRGIVKNLLASAQQASTEMFRSARNLIEEADQAHARGLVTKPISQFRALPKATPLAGPQTKPKAEPKAQPNQQFMTEMEDSWRTGVKIGQSLAKAFSPKVTREPRVVDGTSDSNVSNVSNVSAVIVNTMFEAIAHEFAKMYTDYTKRNDIDPESGLALIAGIAKQCGPQMVQIYDKFAAEVRAGPPSVTTTPVTTVKETPAAPATKPAATGHVSDSETDFSDYEEDLVDFQKNPPAKGYRLLGHDDPTHNSGNFEIELDDFSDRDRLSAAAKGKAKANTTKLSKPTKEQVVTMVEEVGKILQANPLIWLNMAMDFDKVSLRMTQVVEKYFHEHNLVIEPNYSWSDVVEFLSVTPEFKSMLNIFASSAQPGMDQGVSYWVWVATLTPQQRQDVYKLVLEVIVPRPSEPKTTGVAATPKSAAKTEGLPSLIDRFATIMKEAMIERPSGNAQGKSATTPQVNLTNQEELKTTKTELATAAKPEGSVESEPDSSDDLFEL